jgi:hypothetical protein
MNTIDKTYVSCQEMNKHTTSYNRNLIEGDPIFDPVFANVSS